MAKKNTINTTNKTKGLDLRNSYKEPITRSMKDNINYYRGERSVESFVEAQISAGVGDGWGILPDCAYSSDY